MRPVHWTAVVLLTVGVARADDPAGWMTLWNLPEVEAGKIEVRRDAKVFSTAPASMRVDGTGEKAKGSISRSLGVKAGTAVQVSVRIKMGEGLTAARLAVNLIGPNGGGHQVCELDKAGDWQAAKASVPVAPGMTMAFLQLFVEGEGTLWIDELTVTGVADPVADGKLNAFDMGAGYGFGSFEKAVTVADGVARISAPHGRGGAGFLLNADLRKVGSLCPVLHAKRGAKNQSKRLRLILKDAFDNSRSFDYDLTKLSADEFTPLMPADGWPIAPAPDEPETGFDPARVSGHMFVGAWTGDAVDVLLREIAFAQPAPELLAKRKAKAAAEVRKLAQKREAERRAKEALERTIAEGADHPADGPDVQHVCAVAPDILAVRIQERTRAPGRQEPYEARPGDEIREEKKGNTYLAWADGKPAIARARSVWRRKSEKGRPEKLGLLVNGGKTITIGSTVHGAKITAETLTDPRAYRIASADDPAFAQPQAPKAVYRKSKPLERGDSGQPQVRHVVYLKLPSPLKLDAKYTVAFHGVNTRQAAVEYTHDTRRVRSEAIHVTQIGFRPSDPLKRAYLSTWLGTGGGLSYDAKRFGLLDARTRRRVHSGEIRLAVPAGRDEAMRPKKNHNRTDVYYMDFSGFTRPGEYVVRLPDVGTSYPFRIADDVWLAAFKTSLHGLLCHRSGIALTPPWTDYRRPRPFHPADGMKVFRLDLTMLDGESDAVRKSLQQQLGPDLDPSGLKTHPGAWGGYMDAGDWDRRSLHLRVSYLQLELFEMFPDFFEKVRLALPPAEANNALPDLVDEALWNVDFYGRLQAPDGGVGGGVESTAHPHGGETSWQESLLVGAFAPDPASSYRYAASAAKAAGVLRRYDAKRADALRAGAEKAWTWAEAHGERVVEAVRQRGGRVRGEARAFLADDRALAGVELLRLTRAEAYAKALAECLAVATGADAGRQLDATFAYTLLPDDLSDARWKKRAMDFLRAQGAQALAMGEGNAFNITAREPNLPMMGYVGYYTTPETCIGPVLTRLHWLTGEAKYLRGAVAAAQYGAGANPLNATMTTGLGHDYPRAPLHVDSRTVGCPAPRGITIYGPHDPTKAPGWVKTWILGPALHPKADDWPAAEFHIDVSGWPEMSEYTVHQSLGPTGCYWGYLAARTAAN